MMEITQENRKKKVSIKREAKILSEGNNENKEVASYGKR